LSLFPGQALFDQTNGLAYGLGRLILILGKSDVKRGLQLHRGLDHGKGVRAKLLEGCKRSNLLGRRLDLLGNDLDRLVGHIFLEDVQANRPVQAPQTHRAVRTSLDTRRRGLRIEWDIRIAMKTVVWVDFWC